MFPQEEIVVDVVTKPKQEDLPYDYDYFSWWNPLDWGGAYDKNIDAYNARKASEQQASNMILFYVGAGLLAIYLMKK